MKYKLIIFDMDGTILNTLDDLKNALNYALEKNKFPVRTLEEVRKFVGNGIKKLIERSIPENINEDRLDIIYKDFMEYYNCHNADYTRPYDGIIELLEKLKSNNYLTAVVSNKRDEVVQQLVQKYFNNLFDIAIGEKEGMNKKPAPDSVYMVLEKLGIEKKDAVYIGDSDVDIETAKNAGLDMVTVEWGFRDYDFLVERGAKVFASKANDILKYI